MSHRHKHSECACKTRCTPPNTNTRSAHYWSTVVPVDAAPDVLEHSSKCNAGISTEVDRYSVCGGGLIERERERGVERLYIYIYIYMHVELIERGFRVYIYPVYVYVCMQSL